MGTSSSQDLRKMPPRNSENVRPTCLVVGIAAKHVENRLSKWRCPPYFVSPVNGSSWGSNNPGYALPGTGVHGVSRRILEDWRSCWTCRWGLSFLRMVLTEGRRCPGWGNVVIMYRSQHTVKHPVMTTNFRITLACFRCLRIQILRDVSILKYRRYTIGMLSTQNDAHKEIRTFFWCICNIWCHNEWLNTGLYLS